MSLEVVFAPDWRGGVPYQRLLAAQRCDLLHLHWPEAYYPKLGDRLD